MGVVWRSKKFLFADVIFNPAGNFGFRVIGTLYAPSKYAEEGVELGVGNRLSAYYADPSNHCWV